MARPRVPDGTTTASLVHDGLEQLELIGATVTVEGASSQSKVEAGGLVVGSGAEADLRVEDRMVSRKHVQLTPEANGIRVLDLGSRNKTYVNGLLVQDAVLQSDASVSIGQTTLRVHLETERLVVPLSQRTSFGGALGQSRAMRHVFFLLEHAAATNATVLLEGESGTGKDVLARALHQESERRDGPFEVVDCGALPSNLVESELFGHERGAFTGAVASHEGAFERADGGTLFFDEVGELPLELQPKLLRALESRSFRRVGGSKDQSVDVRVVAATNQPLQEAMHAQRFREDLFYRLAVIHVRVPPLSERRQDVEPLAEHFLRAAVGDESATLPEDLGRLLRAYHWPGNARELRNVIDRYATFGRAVPGLLFGRPPATESAEAISLAGLAHLPYHEARQRLLDAFHRAVLPAAISAAGGSVSQAAKQLGIPRTSIYRMLQRLDEKS